jgi:hypothetical protein
VEGEFSELPSIIMRTPGNLAVMSGTHGGT